MKKLSKLIESAWDDMRERGEFKIIRREDEVLLGFGVSEMYDYLKSEYKDTNKVHWMDGDRTECIESGSIGIDPVKGISLYFDYVKDTLVEIVMFYTITSFSREPKEYPEFFKKLSDAFDVSVYKDKPEFSKQWTIKPKSGKLTNKTIIEVLDFFLNTEINESAWDDMRERGGGKQIRKEDEVGHLDQDGLFDYIKCHYKVTKFVLDNDHKPIDKKNQISIPFVIPYEESNYGFCISLEFKKNEKIITFGHSIERDLPNVYKMICDNYRVERHTQLIDKLYPLDGSEITNQFYIDVIEFLIDNVEEDIKIIKRI